MLLGQKYSSLFTNTIRLKSVAGHRHLTYKRKTESSLPCGSLYKRKETTSYVMYTIRQHLYNTYLSICWYTGHKSFKF